MAARIKWGSEGHEVVDEHPKSVHIQLSGVSLSASMQYHLRGEIGACSLHATDPLGGDLLADAVVGHFDVDGVIGQPLVLGSWEFPHQDILRLQVAIYELPRV